MELVDAIDDPTGRVEARLALACILLDGLKPHDALLVLYEAAGIAARLADTRPLRATVALRMARAYCLQRRWAEARRQIHEANQDRELLDPDGLSELAIVEVSACIHGLPRDHGRAAQLVRSAVETARSEGQRATALRHEALVELAHGRIEAALGGLKAAEPMVVGLGDAHGLYQTLIFRVFAQLALLDLTACQATLERLRDVTSRSEIGVMTLNRVSGRVSGLTGDAPRSAESGRASCGSTSSSPRPCPTPVTGRSRTSKPASRSSRLWVGPTSARSRGLRLPALT